MLIDIALFLLAAVVAVPLFKRLGLSAVLGYLAAGIVIGPSGLGLISDVESILHFSEFGVVLLLFIIGLELQPSRLWALRRAVFGLGGAQLLISAAALGGLALALGQSMPIAIVASFGLAMSSTAFVLQLLGERKELNTRHGRSAFAILLLQDMAVIPLLALLPMLGGSGEALAGADFWAAFGKVALALVLVLVAGRYLLRPLLRVIAAVELPEVFTATALLVVLATAMAMEAVGLSMSLGAFLAGVMLADSEFRHELQADIEPFKGLLLGLFFIAVGMSAELSTVYEAPLMVLGLVCALVGIKSAVLFAMGRVSGLGNRAALSLGVALSQGGEFGFVLFGVATAAGVLSAELQSLLIVVVTLSMLTTPLLYRLVSQMSATASPPFDEIDARETDVVIAGFGPFGQIIARILRIRKFSFTILERNSLHVSFVRQFGNAVFYSDAGRLEVLRAAKVERARVFVVAIADPSESLRVAGVVRRNFPRLPVIACARTRQHALQLMNLGVKHVIRRSYFSSLEASRKLLGLLGNSESETERILKLFREHDDRALLQQQAVSGDERQIIQSAVQSARELEQLFEEDPSIPAAEA
ncbi:monovalent cation:proton antiporter-2 (CPA2) family protein [Algiphilus sp. W345]|uniref:Monovalent cation:proton antiporter-2 (CPA2) family protein n=1 Tax=Banduia mediterranea TaxID=3075609 RepID=A0ABU2WHP0_9GAMM|nr:monovalent cation:proton antiporter-2 (CPA2) family protein [Algiphilus sp. W345]MDT0496786.1 monovalent cation:proton antiporter-2 (CPA2) family protein [Algiphilus sp. W345]